MVHRAGSDGQPGHVRVDGLIRVLVAVRVGDEEPVGERGEHGAAAENERVDGPGRDLHLPAVLGEDVPGDVRDVVGGCGVQDTTAGAGEQLVEVVVVVAQGNLRAGDLDPRGAAQVRADALDTLGDGAARVLVDERHAGLVDELGGLNGNSAGHVMASRGSMG